MGCSPSKGHLKGASGPFDSRETLLPGTEEKCKESLSKKGDDELRESSLIQTEAVPGSKQIKLAAQQENFISLQEKSLSLAEVTPGVVVISEKIGTQEVDSELLSKQSEIQADPLADEQQGKSEREKTRKSKGSRQRDKEKNVTSVPSEVDFPDTLTKVHQGAYTSINPTVSKYEALIDLLDQTRQTHLALQPMAALMVLRYEEVNHELEAIADEGEMMLKEYEDYLAWAQPGSSEPLDLLQQMVQYMSTNMKLVSDSTGSLGDFALEEAVNHFASLSALLNERLKAKRVAEQRLVQVLARVKVTALHKRHGPEDSSLYSEDSGIGAESESLAGSERFQRHRESCQSNGCELNSCDSSNIRVKRTVLPGNNEAMGKQEGTEHEPKRPQTATPTGISVRASVVRVNRRSRSVESVGGQVEDHTRLELKRNQEDLTKRLKRMSKFGTEDTDVKLSPTFSQSKAEGEEFQDASPSTHDSQLFSQQRILTRPCLRRHSSGELQVGRKEEGTEEDEKKKLGRGVLRVAPPPNPSPLSVPITPKLHGSRNSVKRLINTFSCKANGSQNQDLSQTPAQLQRARNCGITFKRAERNAEMVNPNDGNTNNTEVNFKTSNRFEDLDVDTLPPPPPEVLMDNSFEDPSGKGMTGITKRGRAALHQRSIISQRLRSSVHTMTVLPNRASIHCGSLTVSSAHSGPQEGHQIEHEGTQDPEPDPEMEEAASLYRQARKIIHLRDSIESPTKKPQVSTEPRKPSPIRAGVGNRQGSIGISEMGSASAGAGIQPATTTAASGPCMLPSPPDISNLVTAKDEVSSSCKLPLLPPGQGGLVSHTSSQCRAPSLPVHKQTQEESSEDRRIQGPSQSIGETRPTFSLSLTSPSEIRRGLETWTPCSSSVLPRPWGESSHTRLPVSIRSPQPFIRHNQTSLSQLPKTSFPPSTIMTKIQSTEPAISLPR
ncbi:hypothetical protein Z043_116222 [Scleropages formosus]|uniref:Photoreceptor cilium actin regulator-like n=1 Tax=Scleropages formosus TaxID=113540 RepID=A0A0P7UTW1_SCLFO|nr:hypothetical protein Z043_116222 [Scleropages formosus]